MLIMMITMSDSEVVWTVGGSEEGGEGSGRKEGVRRGALLIQNEGRSNRMVWKS